MITIAPDSTSATLSIVGTFTPEQLQTLIADLAVARANMLPPVPYERKELAQASDDSLRLSEQSDPYVQIAERRDKTFLLWMRNSGIGWLAFNVSRETAVGIRDYITSRTLDDKAGTPGLFGEQGPEGHGAH